MSAVPEPSIGQDTSAIMPIRTTVDRGLPHMDFKLRPSNERAGIIAEFCAANSLGKADQLAEKR